MWISKQHVFWLLNTSWRSGGGVGGGDRQTASFSLSDCAAFGIPELQVLDWDVVAAQDGNVQHWKMESLSLAHLLVHFFSFDKRP